MYELRYYFSKNRHEVVDTFSTAALAYGMRKKFAMRPQYQLSKLSVHKI